MNDFIAPRVRSLDAVFQPINPLQPFENRSVYESNVLEFQATQSSLGGGISGGIGGANEFVNALTLFTTFFG